MKHYYCLSAVLMFILTVFVACKKPGPQQITDFGSGLLVLNQGNFTYSNASLTFFDLDDRQAVQQVFYSVNGFRLGDVAQSAVAIDTVIYIVVNNSGKIAGISSRTFRLTGIIPGLASPRNMLPVNDSLAIVTDLYANPAIVNYRRYEKVGELQTGQSTEAIVRAGDYVFMTNWSYGNKVFRVDLRDWSVSSIEVVYQPNSMVVDKFNRLWVLSDGGLWEGADTLEVPALTVIDPQDFSVLREIRFDSLDISPSGLNINSAGDTLFFLVSAWQPTENANFGVYRMSVEDTLIPASPFIPQGDRTFYSLNYLEPVGWLAIGDAADFVSPGKVWVYSGDGRLLYEFDAGIIPGFVLYKN